MIGKINTRLTEEFPELSFNILAVSKEASSRYDLVDIETTEKDHTIISRQIVGGGRFDDLEEDVVLSNSVEIVHRAIEGYAKLDKENILKEKRMIRVLNQMEGVSFHKLTEDELAERMKLYNIQEKNFKKKEDA